MWDTSDMSDSLETLTTLETVHQSLKGRLASHSLIHMTVKLYVFSELRRKFSEDRVARAWQLIEELYSEHPELIHKTENSSLVAFGNLTLEAWEEHQIELLCQSDLVEIGNMWDFIVALGDEKREDE